MNDATEWLQYARGLTEMLAEFVHESDSVDCRQMALSLEAVAALTHMGVQSAAAAHARISLETRERAQAEPVVVPAVRIPKQRLSRCPD
ncbi:hypothetical protein [Luteibacter sp. 3190]|uniref:hypothetical protein n=1 Tax=Luteibacter sp. 3190 TaxID=2817736 RepID=UPI00285C2472|nr:hypothetical protein [Luteibacter sp. 3190]MDR6938201.1 uncharacterized protein (DUF4213/DUF364 family) [Luteibacter sp. 3190]